MQFWQWLKKQHNRKRPDFEERGEACVWDPEAVDHLQTHGMRSQGRICKLSALTEKPSP